MQKYKKIKLHIDDSYFKWLLIGVTIFIMTDSILLFVIIGIDGAEDVKFLIEQGHTSQVANFFVNMAKFGAYILDWGVGIIFMISVLLFRRKFQTGYIFLYTWIIIWVLLGLIPFASPVNTTTVYIKCTLLLIPILIMCVNLFKQLNDLKWARRSEAMQKKGSEYV